MSCKKGESMVMSTKEEVSKEKKKKERKHTGNVLHGRRVSRRTAQSQQDAQLSRKKMNLGQIMHNST